MNNNINISDLSKQDEYLIANINNLIKFVYIKSKPQFTNFLDERQQLIATSTLKREGHISYKFFGGTDNCKRMMLGIFDDSNKFEPNFPIVPIKLQYSEKVELSHSDVLGSIMGLQLERECVGDILMLDGCAIIFATQKVSSFLLANLTKVGRTNIVLSILLGDIPQIAQEFVDITGTVASMRLDCVVSLLINKSRTIATDKILSKQVRVNYFDTTDISQKVMPNDTIIIRGFGKYIISHDIKKTKKDRLFITIKKFF